MFRRLLRDLLRFGLVGGLGFLIDVSVFNLLLLTAFSHTPLVTKSISVLAAIAANWAGSRWWAFRDRRGANAGREALAFLMISLAGSAISLGCLGLTHYVFGFTTPLDDNLSANALGLGLGSAFRFVAVWAWLYRHPSTASMVSSSWPIGSPLEPRSRKRSTRSVKSRWIATPTPSRTKSRVRDSSAAMTLDVYADLLNELGTLAGRSTLLDLSRTLRRRWHKRTSIRDSLR